MVVSLLISVAAVVSAVLVGFVARRILGTAVGWPRSIVVGLLVFFVGVPFAEWTLRQTGTSPDASGSVGLWLALIALAIAWAFAIGVAALVASEAIFPTRPLPNPVDLVRAALRQRKRTRRYLEILAIASRHGVGWLFHGGHARVEQELSTAEERANAIVATINDAGVSFVKLGQVLSTRRDLIPEPYLSALSTLQTKATTLPWETVREVIETDLGTSIDEVYAEVDRAPLAAASVAQVHRARLLDGTEVVVKVQRPAARAQVEADADIIGRLAHRAEVRTRVGKDLHIASVARGFTATLLEELDYRIEARNTDMIRSTLERIDKAEPDRRGLVSVPRVFPDASGPRVLTMDLVDGAALSDSAEALATLGPEQRDRLAQVLMSTVIEQILVYGVFHADLHPGNVLLKGDGTLGLIDFGAVGIIERSRREHMTALLLAALSENDVAATDALLLIVDAPDDVDLEAFRHDVGIVLTTEHLRTGGQGSIFTRMVDVIRQHRIALPGELASAFRSFATLEGCLRVIVDDFDMVGRALPLMPTLLRRTLSMTRLATDLQAATVISMARIQRMPRRLEALLTGIEKGSIGVTLRSEEGKDAGGILNRVTAEAASTLVSIAAVVIAVVLIISGGGPVLGGSVTLFAVLGAVIGLFGFLGLLRIVRRTFGGRG
ncbi:MULTISPECIES: AarF/ABC1/UbiB kinase family protein [Microbacterium]|uniref:ABC1 kinase family protein n=1 Tax=Microbacterium TaxID=33882 RepID=UPI0027836614|nr:MULTISPECIES: AarF/UbiB family protein [Microbacterium]MDQ1074291.1 ubiquinone biosynthesis protein [Microbacterium sp. SORGH_AS_0969]MDQ1114519.1 ubiquinone biosynthesis protein [Microbacterium testaceum]